MHTQTQGKNFAEIMRDQVDEVKISGTALDAAIDFIISEFDPDDIFTEKQLSAWAESNGYIKE